MAEYCPHTGILHDHFHYHFRNAGRGVFNATNKDIEIGQTFGPFSGERYDPKEHTSIKGSPYSWEIKDPDMKRVKEVIDAGIKFSHSSAILKILPILPNENNNWMAYINQANTPGNSQV